MSFAIQKKVRLSTQNRSRKSSNIYHKCCMKGMCDFLRIFKMSPHVSVRVPCSSGSHYTPSSSTPLARTSLEGDIQPVSLTNQRAEGEDAFTSERLEIRLWHVNKHLEHTVECLTCIYVDKVMHRSDRTPSLSSDFIRAGYGAGSHT